MITSDSPLLIKESTFFPTKFDRMEDARRSPQGVFKVSSAYILSRSSHSPTDINLTYLLPTSSKANYFPQQVWKYITGGHVNDYLWKNLLQESPVDHNAIMSQWPLNSRLIVCRVLFLTTIKIPNGASQDHVPQSSKWASRLFIPAVESPWSS